MLDAFSLAVPVKHLQCKKHGLLKLQQCDYYVKPKTKKYDVLKYAFYTSKQCNTNCHIVQQVTLI